MATVVLVIHLMLAAALIGVVLLQRSEGGALGIGGGGGGGGGFLTGRGTANLLTRTTAILAARRQHLQRALQQPAPMLRLQAHRLAVVCWIVCRAAHQRPQQGQPCRRLAKQTR
jgi:protein translocase SecG subunit